MRIRWSPPCAPWREAIAPVSEEHTNHGTVGPIRRCASAAAELAHVISRGERLATVQTLRCPRGTPLPTDGRARQDPLSDTTSFLRARSISPDGLAPHDTN